MQLDVSDRAVFLEQQALAHGSYAALLGPYPRIENMAQLGSDANPAGENTAVPEPPSPEQLMAQMAAMVEKMAAMQV